MKTKLLRKILAAIATENTISDIANRLYLSQPYVSQILSRAEKKYCTKLVNRNEKPISLTVAGAKLLQDLDDEIKLHEKTKRDLAFFATKDEQVVRLAITPIWIPNLTATVVHDLQKSFPEVQFQVEQFFTAQEATTLLQNNKIDILWGAFLHQDGITSQYLYRSKAYVIIPSNHVLYDNSKRQLAYTPETFAELNNSDYVSLIDGSLYQNIVDHVFEDDGLQVKKVIKTNDFIGASSLAINGIGITVTLSDVLSYLDKNLKYNLMKLPESLINLDVGISINDNSSNIVKNITGKLNQLILKTLNLDEEKC